MKLLPVFAHRSASHAASNRVRGWSDTVWPDFAPTAMAVATLLILSGCSDRSTPAPKPVPAAVESDLNESTAAPSVNVDQNLKDLFELSSTETDTTGSGIRPQFRPAAMASGIHFQRFSDIVPDRYFLPEVMGGGVALFDLDGDLDMDLYVTNGCPLWDNDPNQTEHINRCFRNEGDGSFTDITTLAECGDNRFGQGCAVGDFNADGFPDLYVCNFGRNTLLVSNGDGTFDDVTEITGVGDQSWGTSAVWVDADSDGLADLYVCNYLDMNRSSHRECTYGGVPGYCGPGQWNGVRDLLYLNQGDGDFKLADVDNDTDVKYAKGLAVAACDFDNDQQPEIYVANDMAPNFLLTRTDSARSPLALYRNVAEAAGCAVSGDGRNEASMGVVCADFDGDGQVDLFLTHYYQHKNTLYRNLGGLLFEDNSLRSRVAATSFESLGFGTVAFDFDLDGDEDMFIANGHVLGPKHNPNAMKPQLLENDGRGLFSDASRKAGGYFDQPVIGRGVAGGDVNNDGRTDLVISHLDVPLELLLGETPTAYHFIGIDLLPKNRVYPVGGQIIVHSNGSRRTIPIVGGGSYLSSNDPRILVGLGPTDGTVDLEIVWPGRGRQEIRNLAVDRYWRISESSAVQSRLNAESYPDDWR